MTIKLLIADGHEVVRAGLVRLLAETDVKVVGQAATGEDAVRLVRKHAPDVVLLDLALAGEGLPLLGRLKREKPDVRVLLRSPHGGAASLARAMALDAAGFLPRSTPADQYAESIRAVATGETVWTRGEMRRVSLASRGAQPDDVEAPLTRRESQVLEYLAQGLTNKQIAEKLGISYETIKEHVQHILVKLGVTDRTQAAVWAVRKGLA